MEEQIQTFSEHFPLNTQNDEYFAHHFEHLNKCISNKLYPSAYLHLHILYMMFVYINILRIAKKKAKEFKLCWVGFPRQEQDFLDDPGSPFSFSLVPEKTVFRFFRIVGFEDGDIGQISRVVKERNYYLHAKGIVHLRDADEFEQKFDSYLQKMMIIIEKQILFLEEIYTLKTDEYEEDFIMNSDEIKSNFTNSEDSFSFQELRLLAVNKKDIVSKFIIDEM